MDQHDSQRLATILNDSPVRKIDGSRISSLDIAGVIENALKVNETAIDDAWKSVINNIKFENSTESTAKIQSIASLYHQRENLKKMHVAFE